MGSSAKKITPEEVWEGINELRKAQKETDRQLNRLGESQEETDRQLRETDRQLRKTDARFNSQWGKLVESLVKGDIVNLFSKRNIPVQGTTQRAKKLFNDKEYEFDIIVHNGAEIIVVEVKTTLRPKYVDHFLKKLGDFKRAFSEYSGKTVYGAVAYLTADASSDRYSENKGLFVIQATGNSSSIINGKDFSPKKF